VVALPRAGRIESIERATPGDDRYDVQPPVGPTPEVDRRRGGQRAHRRTIAVTGEAVEG
jgi:hypothetical protein